MTIDQRCAYAAIVILAVVLALGLGLAIGHAEEPQTYYVAVSELNIRSEPNKDARIVWTRIRDDLVTCSGRMDGLWAEVIIDGPGYTGWVYWPYLSLEAPYEGVTGVIDANGRVRFRDAPSGDMLGWLQPGDEVAVLAVLEDDGGLWYRVLHDGVKGFVLAECVQLDTPK